MTRRGKEKGWGPRARVTPAIQPALLHVASFSVQSPPRNTLFACYGEGRGGGTRVGCVRRGEQLRASCRTQLLALFLHLLALFLHNCSPSFCTPPLLHFASVQCDRKICCNANMYRVCVFLYVLSLSEISPSQKNRALTNSKQQLLLVL